MIAPHPPTDWIRTETDPFGDLAGVAALLASMDPGLSPSAIKTILLDNVDQSSKWSGKVLSGGRLNAYKAAQTNGNGSADAKSTNAATEKDAAHV